MDDVKEDQASEGCWRKEDGRQNSKRGRWEDLNDEVTTVQVLAGH
jgi:hypothetical protein